MSSNKNNLKTNGMNRSHPNNLQRNPSRGMTLEEFKHQQMLERDRLLKQQVRGR